MADGLQAGVFEAARRAPPSAIVESLLRDSDGEAVTIGALLNRSPGAAREILMLLIALLAVIPGASVPAGLALVLLALPMLADRDVVWLPRVVAAHRISVPRLAHLIARVVPLLRWQERMLPPRGRLAVGLRPLVAILVVILSATLLVPLPFSNIPPALSIAMLAVSCLETSGVLLAISALSGLLSLAITSGAVWTALAAAHLILH